jgi:hypothetical protein
MITETAIKGVTTAIAACMATLSGITGAGFLANATGDATIFGFNLSTLEKISLVTGLMIAAGLLGWVTWRLFQLYDKLQNARIEDAKASADALHAVVQANTQALDRNSTTMEQVRDTLATNTETMRNLPERIQMRESRRRE